MLEGNLTNARQRDDREDAGDEPKQAVPRVLKAPSYLLLDEEERDVHDEAVNLVGEFHAHKLVRQANL